MYTHWTGSECVHTVARNVYKRVCMCVKQDRSEMEGQLMRRWMVDAGWRVGGRHRSWQVGKKNFKNSYMHLPNYGRHLSTS